MGRGERQVDSTERCLDGSCAAKAAGLPAAIYSAVAQAYTAMQSMRMGAQTSCMAPVFNNVDASRTSVMVRNLPNNYTRGMLVELFESEGFGGMFDFLHLPIYRLRDPGCVGLC